jgi:hypothetical protein
MFLVPRIDLMKSLRVLLGSIGVYGAAWTLAYVAIMGFDFRYFFRYLTLAWTAQAGELPGYMHVAALSCTFGFMLVVTIAYWQKRRKKEMVE